MDLEASRQRRARARAARRRRRRVLAVAAGAAVAAAACGTVVGAASGTVAPVLVRDAAGPADHRGGAARTAPVPLARLVGDRIVTPMDGTQPSRGLLRRVQAGHVAGVVLFARNVTSAAQVRRAVRRLQAAARAGGGPPLLIMADQEGGLVKRFASVPPRRAPRAMTSAAVAAAEGRATARGLLARGVTVDLAPVADQTADPSSFLYRRTFPGAPAVAARRACAFAGGLRDGGVAATLKHFPGLGGAGANTDDRAVTLGAGRATLESRVGAYRRCGAAPGTLVMVASASYPRALGGAGPAVLRAQTYAFLRSLGATAPTITDDLEAGALRGRRAVATRAVQAGADLLLYAQSERAAARAHAELLRAARGGRLDRLALLAAHDRLAPLRRLG